MNTYNGLTAEAAKREDRGARLMDIYAQRLELSVTKDSDALLRNLLTDLLHWSDTYAVDFDKELRQARDSYQAELAAVVPELDHDRMMAERFGLTISPEQRRERRIVAHLCAHLIARGFQIKGLYDGEEWTDLREEADPTKAAMELIFNLDEASLRIGAGATLPDGTRENEHGIWLILGNGNGGEHMIADWNYTEGDPDCFNSVMEEFDVEQVP